MCHLPGIFISYDENTDGVFFAGGIIKFVQTKTLTHRYMIVLIFMKWSINWEYRMHTATCYDGWTPQNERCDITSTTAEMCPLDYGGTGDGCQPPNLITTLINIALAPGSADEPMFKGQAGVQVREED